MNNSHYILPAEWAPQSAVQLTWPHADTDWQPILTDITRTYVSMAIEIARRVRLIIVSPQPDDVIKAISEQLKTLNINNPEVILGNITTFVCSTNDTWARDHGAITLVRRTENDMESKVGCSVDDSEQREDRGDTTLLHLDFRFNGWGEKFPSNLDNAITRRMHDAQLLNGDYECHLDFVLEGGAIESDGQGSIFTTTNCLLAPHRNQPMTQSDIEQRLKSALRAQRIVWIDHGHLIGDDTDGHIDTLVRLAPNDTILYVACDDKHDEQYNDLKNMERQLYTLRTINNRPYHLLPLPMPRPVVVEGERLPATYANFLVVNGAVLCPTYGQQDIDSKALQTIAEAFPHYEIVGIDCQSIIRQHGSLHCCTMQYPTASEIGI